MFQLDCTEEKEHIISELKVFLASQYLTDHNTEISHLDYETEGCIEVIGILRKHCIRFLDLNGLMVYETINNYELVEITNIIRNLIQHDRLLLEDTFSQHELVPTLEMLVRISSDVTTSTYDVNGFRYLIKEITPNFIKFLITLSVVKPVEQTLTLLDRLMVLKNRFNDDLLEVYLFIIESNEVNFTYLISQKCITDFSISPPNVIILHSILAELVKDENE